MSSSLKGIYDADPFPGRAQPQMRSFAHASRSSIA
jgi:hypothetical protein